MPQGETDRAFDARALAALLEIIGGDRTALAELIGSFLDEGPDLIARIEGAARDGDAEALRRAAHTMKSSAADFGAMELSRLCHALEALGRAGRTDGAVALSQEAAASYRTAAAALRDHVNGQDKAEGGRE